MAALRESAFGQWLLTVSLRQHAKDPRRFRYGPARCNMAGWIYFRVLCGIAKFDYPWAGCEGMGI